MDKKKKPKATSFRLNARLLNRVAHECLDLDMTQAEAVEEGLQWWLAEGRKRRRAAGSAGGAGVKNKSRPIVDNSAVADRQLQSDQTHEDCRREWISALEAILDSGNQDLIDAITSNLRVFHQLARICPTVSRTEVIDAIHEQADAEVEALEKFTRKSRRRLAGLGSDLSELEGDVPKKSAGDRKDRESA